MIALDTNVLLDACDRADSSRQQIAIDPFTQRTSLASPRWAHSRS